MIDNQTDQEQEILALNENLLLSNADVNSNANIKGKIKDTNQQNQQISIKEYKATFDLPKENNNNSFYENFLENLKEENKKKVLSSNNVQNAVSKVKEINVRKVQSNFVNIRKLYINNHGNASQKNIKENMGNNNEENKNNDIQEESKTNHIQLVDKNNNNNEGDDDGLKSETQQKECPQKKKLKIQRTKAPPQLMKKKYIFCCIPINRKNKS